MKGGDKIRYKNNRHTKKSPSKHLIVLEIH